MPLIKSAKKRVRVAKKATIRNAKTKRILKDAVKAFHKAIGSGKQDIVDVQRTAQSELDKAAKKNVMHKNKVARKQRQLSRAAKAAGVATPTKKNATTKTITAKKTTTKKPAAKKTVSKK